MSSFVLIFEYFIFSWFKMSTVTITTNMNVGLNDTKIISATPIYIILTILIIYVFIAVFFVEKTTTNNYNTQLGILGTITLILIAGVALYYLSKGNVNGAVYVLIIILFIGLWKLISIIGEKMGWNTIIVFIILIIVVFLLSFIAQRSYTCYSL